MDTSEQLPPPAPARPALTDLSAIRRTSQDKHLAGVAGGIARHLDIDPVIVRVALVVLVFFGGAGWIIYLGGWLFMPRDDTGEAQVNLTPQHANLALWVTTGLAGLSLMGDVAGGFDFPWPLAIVALVLVVVIGKSGKKPQQWMEDTYATLRTQSGFPPPPPPAAPDAAAGGDGVDLTKPAAAYAPGTVPPPPPAYAPLQYTPAPRSPRKRGPILFWYTLGLIAVALGALAVVDGAGVAVPDSAYAALAVAVTGVMLLVGSVWGRGGGLILVGLVGLLVLAGSIVGEEWDVRGSRIEAAPTSAAAVSPSYEITNGELLLDLREVDDLEALDGRTIDLEGDAGRIEVIVPANVTVIADAEIDGPGHSVLFGEESGGFSTTQRQVRDAGSSAPTLTLDADLTIGEIAVLDVADLDRSNR